MPSPIMKTKLSTGSIREKSCLGLCQKSSLISKKTCSHIQVSQQTAEFNMFIQKFQGDYGSSNTQFCIGEIGRDEAVNQQEFSNDGDSVSQKQPCMFADTAGMDRMEGMNSSLLDLETIFSPAVEPFEFSNVRNVDDNAGSNKDLLVPGLGADDSDDNTSPRGYQAYNVSDFFFSDMKIASLPFIGNMVDDNLAEMNPFPDYKCGEPSMLFDVAEECMALPILEYTAKRSNSNDIEPCEEAMIELNNGSIYLAINQIQSCNQVSDINTDSDQADDLEPQLFIKNLPELSDVVSNFHPIILHESRRRKSVTLVLDLDETLVHSTLDYCGDADFTFNVFFNMRENTIYVKQRPHLHTFLERVAGMFEVIIFTASQSIYAEQLLDILDPERKIISQRVYRESCIFSDGSYTKDLTVLGVDLAKIAIIDNSPQVFRLQVNNGIPIKSWFSDQSDCALTSLLPFLETLVDADDVRPIIAKRFGHVRTVLDYLLNGQV